MHNYLNNRKARTTNLSNGERLSIRKKATKWAAIISVIISWISGSGIYLKIRAGSKC